MTIATTTPTPNAVPKSDGSGALDIGWFPAGTIDAENIAFTPAGAVAATDVQAAIEELDSEKATTGSVTTVATNLSNHLADATDAHDASAISYAAGGALASTNVNDAIDELESLIPAVLGDALTSDGLDQFAATTSAELAGVISDETGTGKLVFATSPTLVTPVLGVATATTINKVTLTQPATGSTLTIVDGKTLTASDNATVSGTNTGDQTNITGNAATVTVADAGGDTTTFVMLATAATGSLAPATDAGISYNATTNVLTVAGSVAANVTGNLTGNADSATTLTGLTASVAELNILDGVTASAAELSTLDGITSSVAELNYTDGVTSAIQTQLDAKAPLANPVFTGTVTLPVGLTGVIRADSGVASVDSDVTDIVAAASDTAAGKVELATIAETTTGTDAARAVTPDGLAGSDYGKRVVQVLVTDPNGSALTTGDGKMYVRINSVLNGYNLVAVAASVTTVSSSGIPTFQIANVTDAVDMLSTKLTIDANEYDSMTAAAAAVIDATKDDVATGDQLRIDCDVAGTGAKGVVVDLTFQAP